MDDEKLIVLGAGRFAREAMELINSAGGRRIVGLVEGIDRARAGGDVDGIPVIWVEELDTLDTSHKAICAISSPRRRALVERVAAYGFEFTSIIAASAEISPSAAIGPGCLVSRGVIMGAGARIGEQVFINRAVLVGHDARVKPFATLSQGVMLGGGVVIDEGAFIGMGAIILEDLVVGKNAVVGAGAVVTRDVPDNVQVLGVPARITKVGLPSV